MNYLDKNILIITNPQSGKGLIKDYIIQIIEICTNRKYNVDLCEIEEGVTLDKYINSNDNMNRYERILISGGDGTINQCVRALIDNSINIPIGILPYGTANDLAKGLGVQGTVEEIMDIALGDRSIDIDVCKVNEMYFINVCAVGMFAGTSNKVNSKLKKILGRYAYYITGVTDLINSAKFNLKVDIGDGFREQSYLLILALNGIGVAGLGNILENRSLTDGRVDLICIKHVPLSEIALLVMDILNRNLKQSKYIDYIQAEQVVITTNNEEDIVVDIDGEKGPAIPVHIEVISRKIKVFSNM